MLLLISRKQHFPKIKHLVDTITGSILVIINSKRKVVTSTLFFHPHLQTRLLFSNRNNVLRFKRSTPLNESFSGRPG